MLWIPSEPVTAPKLTGRPQVGRNSVTSIRHMVFNQAFPDRVRIDHVMNGISSASMGLFTTWFCPIGRLLYRSWNKRYLLYRKIRVLVCSVTLFFISHADFLGILNPI